MIKINRRKMIVGSALDGFGIDGSSNSHQLALAEEYSQNPMVYHICSTLKWPPNKVYLTFRIHPSCHCFPVARVFLFFNAHFLASYGMAGYPWLKDWAFGLWKYLTVIYKILVCRNDLHRYRFGAWSLDRSQHEHVCVDEPDVVEFVILLFESLSLSPSLSFALLESGSQV